MILDKDKPLEAYVEDMLPENSKLVLVYLTALMLHRPATVEDLRTGLNIFGDFYQISKVVPLKDVRTCE